MKRSTVLGCSMVAVMAMAGLARAADVPTKQEGRVWMYQNLTLALSPNWSIMSMPGGRVEFARTREDAAGFHFLEYFFGPNYTYRTGDLTIKGGLWYYYMGYPQRGRNNEAGNCTPIRPQGTSTHCTSGYNLSHNIEVVPSAEYRFGRWSIYDRVIFHNTVYADVYETHDQRQGWGTVLRELLQARYAITDRLGISLADEIFFGLKEDSDTSKIADNGGYKTIGYWKSGYRLNRIYAGFDYKVTPALTVTPQYLLEVTSSAVDGADVTDVTHALYMTVTYVAKLFDDKK